MFFSFSNRVTTQNVRQKNTNQGGYVDRKGIILVSANAITDNTDV